MSEPETLATIIGAIRDTAAHLSRLPHESTIEAVLLAVAANIERRAKLKEAKE